MSRVRPGPVMWAWLILTPVILSAVMVSCQTAPRAPSTLTMAEPEMRVRIRDGVQQASFDGPERFKVRINDGPERIVRGPLLISAMGPGLAGGGGGSGGTGGNRLHMTNASGETLTLPEGATLAIEDAAWDGSLDGSRQPPIISVGSTTGKAVTQPVRYPGRFRLIPTRPEVGREGVSQREPGFDVINWVPMETYLAGVVSGELYRTWGLGVFKVQAIAARSYALQEKRRSRTRGEQWDVESTTADQVYTGHETLPVALQAVRETRGQVLTFEGEVLRAYYSSTCGGRPGAARDVWPTSAGFEFNLAAPIQSHRREHACQESPVYRWQVTRDAEQLSRRIRGWGQRNALSIGRMGEIRKIEVETAAVTGRPGRFKIFDDKGRTFTMRSDELRVACNYAGPETGLPAVKREELVRSGDMEMSFAGRVVTIKGRGFGHGVGMCQFCAKGFTDKGEDYRLVTLKFYPGSKIERLW